MKTKSSILSLAHSANVPATWLGRRTGTVIQIPKTWLPIMMIILFCASAVSRATDLTFSQMDFDLDGTVYTDTEWGSVDLGYAGTSENLYFNLAVNGTWQIQNMPIISWNGVGLDQTLTMLFDLGVTRGTPVMSLNYGYTLTAGLQTSMPGDSILASLGKQQEILYSGLRDASVGALKAPDAPGTGASLIKISAGAKNFPNQECGKKECVPASVANSLAYLKKEYSLDIPDADISIEKMKTATGWSAENGCWGDHTADHNAWWEDKDAYMKENDLPITTTKIDFGRTKESRIAAIEEVIRQRDAGQDVEILWTGHAVALVGAVALSDGTYMFYVNHDRKQGKDGGCITEPVCYDPATGIVIRAHRMDQTLAYAVVECPEPAASAILLLGSFVMMWLRRKPRR